MWLSEFRLALIQLAVTANKADNVRRATELIANASKQGAQVISLPVSKCFSHMLTLCRGCDVSLGALVSRHPDALIRSCLA